MYIDNMILVIKAKKPQLPTSKTNLLKSSTVIYNVLCNTSLNKLAADL